MGVNRGKAFEDVVRRDFDKVSELSIDRLHDQTNGYLGSSNICDFYIYKKPTLLYLETKSCYGNTLNFSNITNNQWLGLKRKSLYEGVKAGVMIWFIDHDKTYYVPIETLHSEQEKGSKSVNIKTVATLDGAIEVIGTKKKIFFTYDMESFWSKLNE